MSGVAASLAHVTSTFVFGENPLIPSLGASGAISGVMGGYLVLHPHRRVTVIMLSEAPDFRFLSKDVPVLGSAECGSDGAFILNEGSRSISYVGRQGK